MAETASATIAVTQLGPADWQYSITLNDTGTTSLGTFWFAWVPEADFLATSPSSVSNPAGWNDTITNAGSSDGYAIRWVASSSSADVASGGTLSGFTFTSSDAPAAVFGDSVFYTTTQATTSTVYSGAPFSDPGFTFVAAEAACFLPGTRILTDRGEVPVERLQVGDAIVTQSGQARPLCWIGHGRALATHGRRNAATPVIIRKGALAPNVPNRDLHVTKGHALYFDGVLIPVEFLVNHRSVLWDDQAGEVTVYHLELDTHDILLANGAPAESYRDDGNRWLFQNANTAWDQPPKPPCAPVLTGGPIVDAVWQRLLDRAGPRPGLPLTDDPGLHLLVDGTRIDAATRSDGVHVFAIQDAPATVRIVSNAAVPQELGLARDPRALGVAIRRIVIRQGTQFLILRTDDQRLTDGFHAPEADPSLRWTNGNAILPPQAFASVTGPFEIVIHLAATARYIDGTSPTRRAA